MVRLGLLLVMLGACSFDKTGIGAGNDGPPGGIDAATDGPPSDAACASTCAGAVLKGCGGSPDVTCDLGCSTMGGAHCEEIVPSNGIGLDALTGVTGGLTTTASADTTSRHEYTIDTDTGLIQDWGATGFPTGTPSTVRAAGTGVRNGMGFQTTATLATLAVDHLTIARESVLYGFGTRPLAILSSGDVAIEGAIDFSAGCYDADGVTFLTSCGGAGGGDGGSGNQPAGGCGAGGNGVDSHSTGGGGGGFATAGAKGGDQMGANGGAAGTSAACPGATLEPLAGGGGGGAGRSGKGGTGGGGGGGLQITSLTRIGLTHSSSAVNDTMIYVAGAGGAGPNEVNSGGGGGGAGGGILLEAPMVQIGAVAILSANGGGGAGGRQTILASDGAYGTKTTAQAAGGVGDAVVATTGRGGPGGAKLGAPAVGTGGGDGTGGGGGATGRIRINTLAAPTLTGAVVSPDASLGALKLQ